MKHPKRYTKETYFGMTTIAGCLAGMIQLCNRLTIPVRIACQAFLILCYVAVCLACYRVYHSMMDRSITLPHRKRTRRAVLSLLSLVLILEAIILLTVIPFIPLLIKSTATCLGNALWLRLQLHLLPKGADTT